MQKKWGGVQSTLRKSDKVFDRKISLLKEVIRVKTPKKSDEASAICNNYKTRSRWGKVIAIVKMPDKAKAGQSAVKICSLIVLFCSFICAEIAYAESVSPNQTKAVEAKKSDDSSATQDASKKPPQLKPAPVPSYNMGKEWKAVRQVDGVSTYRLKTNANTIGTFHARSLKKPFKRKKSKSVFEKMMKRKAKALALLNITGWKVDSHSWKKKKNNQAELTIEGSYKTPVGESVFFKEVHYFNKKKVFQILMTSQEKDFLHTPTAQGFFNKAKAVLNKKMEDRVP